MNVKRYLVYALLLLNGLTGACTDTPGDAAATTALARPDTAEPPSPSEPTATLAPPVVLQATQTPPPTPVVTAPGPEEVVPGALIGLSLSSSVGVLLDEFPAGMRDRVVASLLAQPESFWTDRAEAQVQLMKLRLNFRDFVYDDKGQLPLPPRALWGVRLDPAGPSRASIQGHDLLLWPFTFTSTLLTDPDSPGMAEPALAAIGGIWEEPFVFPADPTLLLQRTGNACINEGGFPPESFDSENAWHFYDYECAADSAGALGCHRTVLPALSCREALQARVGEVETSLRFERMPWDAGQADAVRVGGAPTGAAPDLAVVEADLQTNRIVYRFVQPDDCALEEGAVGSAGWRRLLQFDATVYNAGGQALHIGPVVAEDDVNNVFDYSPCHDHFHYSFYGEFFLEQAGDLRGSKQAFCVQSTSRYGNHESSPLTHGYTCSFQGIQAGWVDEYVAGLDAQWMDVTDLALDGEAVAVTLGFRSNADRFLCEGTPLLDASGQPQWEATGEVTDEGEPINRPQCDFLADWDRNNLGFLTVNVPATGSFVTAPCAGSEVGPLRNCGFAALDFGSAEASCTPGETVDLRLDLAGTGEPQVVRVCETSSALDQGIACTYGESLANVIVESTSREFAFSCPAVRDASPATGGFSLLAAPVWPADSPAPLEVTVMP